MSRGCRVALLVSALTACNGGGNATSTAYDVTALPTGPVGESIRYGHDLIVDTHHYMKANVRAKMDCAACHLDAGTKPKGGSFLDVCALPAMEQARASRHRAARSFGRMFLVQHERHAAGVPSREMIALVAYIAWLSRGTRVGAQQKSADSFIEPLPRSSPNTANGATIYATRCTACHQANGAGIAASFPPLWGSTSFNDGVGMAHLDRMTGFVHYNMPLDAPGTLSLEDAYDVSAFVLRHKRPHFQPNVVVRAAAEPARYF